MVFIIQIPDHFVKGDLIRKLLIFRKHQQREPHHEKNLLGFLQP